MIFVRDAVAPERQRHTGIWHTIDGYSEPSMGLADVPRFMDIVQPRIGASVIDVGAGNCCATKELASRGMDAWGLDITATAVPSGVSKFYEMPAWGEWRGAFTYAFCCDVMQFLPVEYAMLSIDRMLTQCRTVWLHISFIPDKFSDQTGGEPLHLTVMPYEWWLGHIASVGRIEDARDLCDTGLFVVRR